MEIITWPDLVIGLSVWFAVGVWLDYRAAKRERAATIVVVVTPPDAVQPSEPKELN